MSETIFLLIRESGIRMPRATGTAVTIVDMLVMGDAVVNDGIISVPTGLSRSCRDSPA